MVSFRQYLETFITNSDCLDVIMMFLVVLTVSAVLKVLCFGLYK